MYEAESLALVMTLKSGNLRILMSCQLPSDESSEMQLPNTVMYGAWADRCTANRSQERERVGRKCLFIRTRGCSEEGATVLDFREDDTASTGFLCWMIIKSKPMFRKIESLNCKPLTDQEELTTGSSHFGNKRCWNVFPPTWTECMSDRERFIIHLYGVPPTFVVNNFQKTRRCCLL